MSTYQFLQPYRYQETPVRLMPHASYVMGERVQRSYSSHLTPGGEYAVPNPAQESGYQVRRAANQTTHPAFFPERTGLPFEYPGLVGDRSLIT